jgi:serine/threonine protein kinase
MAERSLPDKSIFLEALEIPSASQRAVFLDQACGTDQQLRAAVEALLRAHDRSGDLLDLPERPAATAGDPGRAVPPGTVIGPYKLLEQIGEGGMGVVYVAQQQHPVRRTVALKLIKPGLDSRQVITRLEAERQALALMDHPNIAKVLDAGTTETGRPYFVMELVKGASITDYCDRERLTTRPRLGLFVRVCQALQHAHQKGVIHRDVKQSNVLVAVHDVTPVVKVIDFGTAKAIGQPLTDRTNYTGFAQIIGTPLYMSPEQAGMSALDVDTRSDIYSLGVLLYELLTGTTPFESATFREAGYDEMRRMIREDEPPRPSARLSTLEKGQLSTVSERRGIDARRLSQEVRGDLDWVVMKALEKDRNRRYESASAFAADVQRYLDDEPVQAYPPTAGYRLRKFVRRNRGPVLATALVVLALVLGMAGSLWQAVRATQAEGQASEDRDAKQEALRVALANEQKAEAAKIDAEKAAADAKQANELAQARLGHVKKANEVLASIFRDLDPQSEGKGGPPLKEQLVGRLDQAAAQLNEQAIGDPLTVAGLQAGLGDTYLGLGEAPKAIELLVKAHETRHTHLGPDHPDTLSGMGSLGVGYLKAGKVDLALSLLTKRLELCQAKLGSDHPETLDSMDNLAVAYLENNEPARALPLLKEELRLRTARLGPDQPDTNRCLHNLAVAYHAAGKLDLALPLFKEELERQKARFGPDHSLTLTSMNNLAAGYKSSGKLDLALPLFEETLERMKAKLGPDHPVTLTCMHNLGLTYQDAGKRDLALSLLQETLERRKAKLGPDHPDTLTSMNNLAVAYLANKEPDRAMPLVNESLAAKRKRLGAGDPRLADPLARIAFELLKAREYAAAEPLLRECLAIREKQLPDSWLTFNTRSVLGAALLGQKKYAEAEPLLIEGYEGMQKRLAQIPPRGRVRVTEALQALVDLYEATGQQEKAEPWRQKLKAAAAEKAGGDR